MAALGSNMKGRAKMAKEVADKAKGKSGAKPGRVKLDKKRALKPKAVQVAKKQELKPKAAQVAKKQELKPKAAKIAKKQVSKQELVKATKKKEKKSVDQVGSTSKKGLRNARLVLEPSKRKKIRKIKVILEGELTINNVDEFRLQIEPVFKDYDFIDFRQQEVTSLDLPHIQLMYYFQNHFKKSKTVTIDSNLSVDLKKVIVNAGFEELMFIPKLV